MKKYLRHLGSTIALMLGILRFLAAFGPSYQPIPSIDGMIKGLMIILGALAYRSAKRRKLGVVKDPQSRIFGELFALALLFALVVLVLHRNDLKAFVVTQPTQALLQIIIIPLW